MIAGGQDPFATQPEDSSESSIVVARYESECAECLGWISEGEEIQADGRGAWRHAECMPLLLVQRGMRKCRTCFTVITPSGACNCD